MRKGKLKFESVNWIIQKTNEVEPPKDFIKWIDQKIWKYSYKMFFKTLGKKQYLGACQHCKRTNIPLKDVKAGHLAKCPICNASVVYRNEKHSKYLNEHDFVSFIGKVEGGGFVVKNYKTFRESNYLDYKIHVNEMERCYINKDLNNKQWFHPHFRYDFPSGSSSVVMCKGYYKNMSFTLPGLIDTYTKNLKKIFADTPLKYCCLEKFAANMPIDAPSSILEMARKPFLEYFIKLKMFNLTTDVICSSNSYMQYSHVLNYSSNNMKQIIKLSGEYYDYAVKNNPNMKMIGVLQELQTRQIPITKENIAYVSEWYWRLYEKELHTLNYISLENLIKYAKEQFKTVGNATHFITDYEDYIKACEELHYNLEDTMYLKPNNFTTMHDNTMKILQELRDQKKAVNIKKQLKKVKKFEFANQTLQIITPENSAAITEEGKNLHHCVGTYLDRVAEGRSIIMFIRKLTAPNKSYYTIEINPKDLTVVQCRGNHNANTTKEVDRFINEWNKKVILPLKQTG